MDAIKELEEERKSTTELQKFKVYNEDYLTLAQMKLFLANVTSSLILGRYHNDSINNSDILFVVPAFLVVVVVVAGRARA